MSWEASTRYWFQFTRNFRSASILNKEDTFQQLLSTLQSTEKELIPAKIHLLSFLQQQSEVLLISASHCHQTLDLLTKQLLEVPCSNPAQVHLIEQIMVTITCLLILFDENSFEDPPHTEYLEKHINTLLEIIRGTLTATKTGDVRDAEGNTSSFRDFGQSFERGLVEVAAITGIHLGGIQAKSQERCLRLCAAECLRELEENFPGLLEDFYEEILALSQHEITHACQSYSILAATILCNCRKEKSSKQIHKTNLLPLQSAAAQTQSMNNFNAPKGASKENPKFNMPYAQLGNAPKFHIPNSEELRSKLNFNNPDPPGSIFEGFENKRELIKVLEFFHESMESTSGWGTLDLFQKLLRVIEREQIPAKKIFDGFFKRFKRTYNLSFTQQMIILLRRFPGQFDEFLPEIRSQIQTFSDCSSISSPAEQNLVLMWCSETYPELFDLSSAIPTPLLPQSFDRISVRLRKVFLGYQIEHWIQEETESQRQISLDFSSLKQFRYYPSTYYTTSGIIDILRHVLCSFPETSSVVSEFLRNLLKESPRFVCILLRLLDSKEYPLPDEIRSRLLNISCYLLSYEVQVVHMIRYLPLIEYLLSQRSVDPIPLFNCLMKMLRSTNLLERDSWALGNKLLKLVRGIIANFDMKQVYAPLCELLGYIGEHFGDVDIREHARFYLRLVMGIPQDMLILILSHQALDKLENAITVLPVASPVSGKDQGNQNDSILGADSEFRLQCSLEGDQGDIKRDFVIPRSLEEHEIDEIRSQSIEDRMTTAWNKYLNCLASSGSKISPTVRHSLPIEVKFDSSDSDEGKSNNLYSVVLRIAQKGEDERKLYFPFSLIHIPVLSSTANSFLSRLCYAPKQPIPVSLEVSASYQDETGAHKEISLPDLGITLPHLLFPLNIPKETLDALQIEPKELKSAFLNKFWAESLLVESAESLKVLKVSYSDVIRRIKSSSLLVSLQVSDDEQENERIVSFLAFLAPKYHLAMEFHVFATHCDIQLKCDYWPVLSLVDPLLNQIFLKK